MPGTRQPSVNRTSQARALARAGTPATYTNRGQQGAGFPCYLELNCWLLIVKLPRTRAIIHFYSVNKTVAIPVLLQMFKYLDCVCPRRLAPQLRPVAPRLPVVVMTPTAMTNARVCLQNPAETDPTHHLCSQWVHDGREILCLHFLSTNPILQPAQVRFWFSN